MPKIALYLPRNYKGNEKWIKIREIVKEESQALGVEYIEKIGDEEYPIVYLEDSETSTFIYVEDSEEDDTENVRAMIRVLTLVALLGEEKERAEVEEREVRKRKIMK